MRRFMIFLLLVSLMGCSTPSTGDVENPNTPDVTDNTEETPGDIQEEHDTIIEKYGEEKLQEKFRTVLKESKYYDSIFDGNKAVLTVLADSIEIRREDQDIPMITITQDDEYSVTPKMHFTDTFEFDYIKDGITKDAKLIIAYYANDNDNIIFPLLSCFCTFVKKSVEHICVILILGLFCSTDLCVCPSTNITQS